MNIPRLGRRLRQAHETPRGAHALGVVLAEAWMRPVDAYERGDQRLRARLLEGLGNGRGSTEECGDSQNHGRVANAAASDVHYGYHIFILAHRRLSSSSCGRRRGSAPAVAPGPVSLDEATLSRPVA